MYNIKKIIKLFLNIQNIFHTLSLTNSKLIWNSTKTAFRIVHKKLNIFIHNYHLWLFTKKVGFRKLTKLKTMMKYFQRQKRPWNVQSSTIFVSDHVDVLAHSRTHLLLQWYCSDKHAPVQGRLWKLRDWELTSIIKFFEFFLLNNLNMYLNKTKMAYNRDRSVRTPINSLYRKYL